MRKRAEKALKLHVLHWQIFQFIVRELDDLIQAEEEKINYKERVKKKESVRVGSKLGALHILQSYFGLYLRGKCSSLDEAFHLNVNSATAIKDHRTFERTKRVYLERVLAPKNKPARKPMTWEQLEQELGIDQRQLKRDLKDFHLPLAFWARKEVADRRLSATDDLYGHLSRLIGRTKT